MYSSALTELQAFLGDFAFLLSRLGLHWKGDKGVRIALIGVEKDELTILVGIPMTLYPTEEPAPPPTKETPKKRVPTASERACKKALDSLGSKGG